VRIAAAITNVSLAHLPTSSLLSRCMLGNPKYHCKNTQHLRIVDQHCICTCEGTFVLCACVSGVCGCMVVCFFCLGVFLFAFMVVFRCFCLCMCVCMCVCVCVRVCVLWSRVRNTSQRVRTPITICQTQEKPRAQRAFTQNTDMQPSCTEQLEGSPTKVLQLSQVPAHSLTKQPSKFGHTPTGCVKQGVQSPRHANVTSQAPESTQHGEIDSLVQQNESPPNRSIQPLVQSTQQPHTRPTTPPGERTY
jgi:hypothetical protein